MPSSIKKSVAVIGAGPGGLVAAKKLLQTGSFDVTIFDKSPSVGGLWERNNLINPQMQTNFCMFTVAFSDLSWDSIDLDGRPSPMYPRAWMVERYLEEYARFIPEGGLRLGTLVKIAERVDGADGKRWKLTVVEGRKKEEQAEHFDYLVVATGYLSQPKALDCEVDDALREEAPVPIMHSTSFRNIEQLYPSASSIASPKAQKVLIVGGSHSGSEISTLIAFQASTARWSPGSNPQPAPELEILHVTNHKMLAVPAFTRDYASPTCAFQPLEYKLYDRASRPPKPISHTFGLTNPQESQGMKMMIEAFVNGEMNHEEPETEIPAYAVVNETYTQFVESKVVKPMIGQLKRLEEGKQERTVTATIMTADGETILEGITAVINATGFDSCGSLFLLSEDVRNELGFDPTSTRLPLVLDTSYMAQRSSVPNIAVLGFTGVNWGVMEMQARAIAAKWTLTSPIPEIENETSKQIAEHINILRDAIKAGRKTKIPQVLFGDYLGPMEQACRELHLERVDMGFNEFEGMVCPARYVDPGSDKQEAIKTMTRLQEVQLRSREQNLYLARAAFHGLSGKWISVDHKCEIAFHPRIPTAKEYEFEYMVLERDRKSIYRYDEVNDEISVWSVSQEDSLSADALAFKLKFIRAEIPSDPNNCTAEVVSSSHRDARPGLIQSYGFEFKGSHLAGFHISNQSDASGGYTVDFARLKEDITVVEKVNELASLAVGNQSVVQVGGFAAEEVPMTGVLKGNCCSRFNRIP